MTILNKKDGGRMKLRYLESVEEVRGNIGACQALGHVQQAVFSTYHDALTQICFTCCEVVTNI